jgi:hypothetical protein
MTRQPRSSSFLRAALATLFVTPALACGLIVGLDKNFEKVACLHDCDAADAATESSAEASADGSMVDAAVDAAGDAAFDPCGFVDVTDPGVTSNADWAGWPMPNVQGVNKAAYAVTGDVVHDLVTGLRWQRVPAATGMSVAQGAAYCATLAPDGGLPWRMPTSIELASLQRYRNLDANGDITPPCMADEFVAAGPLSYFLSNSTVANSGGADHVGFYFETCGSIIVQGIDTAQSIRCVQGPPSTAHFQVSPKEKCNIVRDLNTGLEWDRDLSTVAFRVETDAGSVDTANNVCAEVSKTKGAGWTLPTSPEAYSLIDMTRRDPTMSTVLFPGTPANGKLISSSLRRKDIVAAIQISEGTETGAFFAEAALVRCVRHLAK